jgi:hypothetical protein
MVRPVLEHRREAEAFIEFPVGNKPTVAGESGAVEL